LWGRHACRSKSNGECELSELRKEDIVQESKRKRKRTEGKT